MSQGADADARAEPDSAQPVGQGDYVVQPGDCIESIAAANGFHWQTLWDLGENAELKRLRKPNVLLPGDRVTIPEPRQRIETRATDTHHPFVLRGVPSRLRLRFVDDRQQPRAGLAFTLTIDDVKRRGALDGDGALDVPISPFAMEGLIELESDDGPETYALKIGQLDPQSALSGIVGRLRNLGFACDLDNADELRWAIMRFQQANDIDVTGAMDGRTLAALMDRHES